MGSLVSHAQRRMRGRCSESGSWSTRGARPPIGHGCMRRAPFTPAGPCRRRCPGSRSEAARGTTGASGCAMYAGPRRQPGRSGQKRQSASGQYRRAPRSGQSCRCCVLIIALSRIIVCQLGMGRQSLARREARQVKGSRPHSLSGLPPLTRSGQICMLRLLAERAQGPSVRTCTSLLNNHTNHVHFKR